MSRCKFNMRWVVSWCQNREKFNPLDVSAWQGFGEDCPVCAALDAEWTALLRERNIRFYRASHERYEVSRRSYKELQGSSSADLARLFGVRNPT